MLSGGRQPLAIKRTPKPVSRNPPREAKPSAYWLWLNGYANRDYFDKELGEFAEKGVGGLCIFDMGARGDAKFFPPTGPAFMSEDSVESIARATRSGAATRIWMFSWPPAAVGTWEDLGSRRNTPAWLCIAPSSEWKGRGSWTWTSHFQSCPRKFRAAKTECRLSTATSWCLAVPETNRLPGHEFIFRLPRGDKHRIDHVVLYNAQTDDPEKYGALQLFSKDFAVAVSTTEPKRSAFREVVAGIVGSQLRSRSDLISLRRTPAMCG